jgi:cyclohexadienyl dehydratase
MLSPSVTSSIDWAPELATLRPRSGAGKCVHRFHLRGGSLLRGMAGALAASLALAGAPVRADEVADGPPLLDDAALIGQVLALADERLALMPAVAAAKWPRHLPLADPAREQAVIADAAGRATALGLAPEAVAGYFRVQIALAVRAQQRLYERWAAAGFDAAANAPDLAADLRPRLDRLTADTLRALYLFAPLNASGEVGARARALAADALPRVRWDDADRAQLVDALAAVHGGHGASVARARAAGVLRIGTPGDYAPFSVAREHRLAGADVELALSLAHELGLDPVFVGSSWRALLEDLRADRFDLAVGGISVTPARSAAAAFSAATSRSGKTAIGRCADAARLARFADIDRPSVTVVFNPGGTNESFARRHLRRARLLEHADNRTVFDELEAHGADVMFTDEIEVALATRRHPVLCRLLPDAFEPTDKAFLLPKGSDWAAVVDPWLARELGRGTPARLLERYLEP